MMVSSVPEKTLLKPRATTVLCVRPVRARSMPGSVCTWSDTVTAAILATSSAETVETEAGASSAFSWRRDTVTTTGLSTRARERSAMSTSAVPPAVTLTPSTRAVS